LWSGTDSFRLPCESCLPAHYLHRRRIRLGSGHLLGLAFPRHLQVVLLWLIAAAIALELLQFVRPDRDPRFFDAIAKIVGAVAGVGAAWMLANMVRRQRRA
jgi:hypothetical protein